MSKHLVPGGAHERFALAVLEEITAEPEADRGQFFQRRTLRVPRSDERAMAQDIAWILGTLGHWRQLLEFTRIFAADDNPTICRWHTRALLHHGLTVEAFAYIRGDLRTRGRFRLRIFDWYLVVSAMEPLRAPSAAWLGVILFEIPRSQFEPPKLSALSPDAGDHIAALMTSWEVDAQELQLSTWDLSCETTLRLKRACQILGAVQDNTVREFIASVSREVRARGSGK